MEHQYQRVKKTSQMRRVKRAPDETTPTLTNNVLQLQHLIGNRATEQIYRQPVADVIPFDHVTGQVAEQADDERHPPLLPYNMMTFENLIESKDFILSQLDAAQDEASYTEAETELKAINDSLQEKAAAIFSKFNPEIVPTLADIATANDKTASRGSRAASQQRINFGLPAETVSQVKFIDVMSLYLGNSEKVAAHFGNVRQANVPGTVFLHESAAKQIEGVQNDIGKENMPTSYVALGIRGRYHERESKSRMAHPLGYAVDYYPADTPMVTDKRVLKLLETVTGESSHLNFTNERGGKIGYGERRSMIKAMGEGADKSSPEMSKAVEHFMAQVDGEIKRVANASLEFRKSLGQGNTEQLRQLRVDYINLKANQARLTSMTSKGSITKLMQTVVKTNKGKTDPAEIKKLMADTQAGLGEATADLEELMSPWAQMIEQRLAELEEIIKQIEDRIKEIEDRVKDVDTRLSEIDARVKSIDAASKTTTDKETKTALRAERAELTKERGSLSKEKGNLAKEKSGLEKQRKTPDTERTALQKFAMQIQEIETAQTTMAQNKAQLDLVPEKMQKLMSPWFKLIDDDLKEQEAALKPLDARLEEVETRLKSIQERATAIDARNKAIGTALGAKGTPADVRAALNTEKKDLAKEKTQLLTEQKTLTGEQKGLQKQRAAPKKERQTLVDLSTALKDPEFVLGTSGGATMDSGVKDVSIMQLVNRGFFTIEGDQYDPDVQLNDGSMRENPKRSPDDTRAGFNSKFMQTMMRHGFDLGIAWDTLDAMHFELVTGVESVADKDDTAAGFAEVAKRYAERKKKKFEEKK